MAETRQIYRCARCGQIIEVLHGGAGELVCCGAPMELQKVQNLEAAREKHLPVLTAKGDRTHVQVGSLPHPMTDQHFIEWIELECAKGVMRCMLAPGEAPEADFPIPLAEATAAEAWCNLHGLWEKRNPCSGFRGQLKNH